MNGPQALQVNPGCFICISGITLSLANENLFKILLIFILNEITFKTKCHLTVEPYLMVS